jgi:hypothetical protein
MDSEQEEKIKQAVKSGINLGFIIGVLAGLSLSSWAVFLLSSMF